MCVCEGTQGAPSYPTRCHLRVPSSEKPFLALVDPHANIYRSVPLPQALSPHQGQGLSLILVPSTQASACLAVEATYMFNEQMTSPQNVHHLQDTSLHVTLVQPLGCVWKPLLRLGDPQGLLLTPV